MNHATIRPRGRSLARFIHELVEAGWAALQSLEGLNPQRRRHALVRVDSRRRPAERRSDDPRRTG